MVAIAPPSTQQVTGSVARPGLGASASPARPLIAMSVELLVNSSAWQAASRPTLRLVLFIYTVSGWTSKTPASFGSALFPIQGRFESEARSPFDDGWTAEEPDTRELQTTVTEERARSIIARNDSPDIPFEQSINPYRGCEHGCIYCYARPSHAYLELSPGLDFETKLFAKTNAAELLKEELASAATAEPDRLRHQHRLLPADRAQLQDHARPPRGAGRLRPPAHHRHQVGAHRARHRPARADGEEEPGQGVRLDHHARPRAGAHAGAARGEPAAPGGRAARACGGIFPAA